MKYTLRLPYDIQLFKMNNFQLIIQRERRTTVMSGASALRYIFQFFHILKLVLNMKQVVRSIGFGLKL